jgi:uncharacterized damage-inducible protein DinB
MRLASAIAAAVVVAVLAVSVAAQSPQPVAQAVRAAWDGAKKNIQESAGQMPEANYAFKPVDSVRSFGQILAHIAGANYVFCAAAKGEKAPHAEDEFEKSATTRAAITKALSDSIAYCDAAFAAIDDKTLGAPIDMPFGMGKGTKASALLGNIGHLNEHYGNLVTYFRLKGMVPPSSKR